MFSFFLFCLLLVGLWLYARARPVASSPLHRAGNGQTLVISHGDEANSGLYPGNTLHYLQQMVELGVDALEFDLNLTADGALVLIHDGNLERTSDGRGAVQDMTLEELRRLNAAHRWTRDGETFPYRARPLPISTVDEVFAALPNTPMIIELKNNDLRAAAALAHSVRAAGAETRVVVSSFHYRVIAQFRQLCPQAATGATLPEGLLFFAAQLLGAEKLLRPAYQTMQLPPEFHGIRVFTRRFVRAAHRCGLHLSVWTVDKPEEMRAFIALGLDGIVTNRPDTLLSLRG
ncbi:glycerophosphodiester phosphodiesterase [Microbulbifer sp. SAOS-129_SWC]|uniref:glycerophosphodiester phosphodiesterase n=1 Tax=Microbulbifer sp. SAOS-129_SWC TaxID=3145235 RepID=UPI003217306C